MFKHIFIYRLKVLLRSKSMIFWTLFFPIALSILFYFAFSGLRTTDSFHSIPVAYVEETENPVFSSLLEVLSQENELFDLTVMDESTAKDALESNEITGYFQSKETVTLKVASNGMDQSILKSFLDRYEQTSATIERIALTSDLSALDWDALYEDTPVSINQTPISNSELDLILSFFYALIAMTCFYGGYFGLEEIIHIQGDLSKLGARLNISPVHKLKTLLYSLSASAFIVILEMSVFLLFLSTVLKV
ncbi:MAG TPA: hypothetical protein DHN33_00005, partial [Eubacteriaceae bacterium]|nr:hypothetical protein [Eubacteriaceae bacterium]